MKLPALHDAASNGSCRAQSLYGYLIISEYGCLVVSAILSMDLMRVPGYYVGASLVFFLSLAIMLFRSVGKHEEQWYKCRAVAESVKTLSWRYAMAASPFDATVGASALFRNALSEVLKDAAFVGSAITGDVATEDQVTEDMDAMRALSMTERLTQYKANRIADQRSWYSKKASQKRRMSTIWIVLSIIVYVFAALTVLLRIEYPDWTYLPTAPFIVIASSFLGWVQIKRYNELAAAYTITAHEIGIIQNRIADISDEIHLSEFINDAEMAFSREHTQWVARHSR